MTSEEAIKILSKHKSFAQHELKIKPYYFEAVADGRKTFELRKDDRAFEIGDVLILREYRKGKYTGNNINAEITYVLRDCPEYGLKDGYAILGIRTIISNF